MRDRESSRREHPFGRQKSRLRNQTRYERQAQLPSHTTRAGKRLADQTVVRIMLVMRVAVTVDLKPALNYRRCFGVMVMMATVRTSRLSLLAGKTGFRMRMTVAGGHVQPRWCMPEGNDTAQDAR